MTKKEKRQIGRESASIGVFGGHRTGKRRRGNSLTKKAPRANTTVTTYNIVDTDGIVVGRINTLRYTR
jgi:hypothetical protein